MRAASERVARGGRGVAERPRTGVGSRRVRPRPRPAARRPRTERLRAAARRCACRTFVKTFGDLVAVADVSGRRARGGVRSAGAERGRQIDHHDDRLRRPAGRRGTRRIAGEPLTPADRDLRNELGVVPQDFAVYPELTARQNLRFFGKLYGLRGARLDDRVADALDRTGLTNRADDRAEHYSGGMKRRLNFGCAILHEPAVLILDEPTVGVDPQSRAHLLAGVTDVAAEGSGDLRQPLHGRGRGGLRPRRRRGRRPGAGPGHDPRICSPRSKACCACTSPRRRARPTRRPCCPAATPTCSAADRTTVRPPTGGVVYELDRSRLTGRDETTLSAVLAPTLEHLRDAGGRLEAVHTDEPNLERLFLQLTGNTLRD